MKRRSMNVSEADTVNRQRMSAAFLLVALELLALSLPFASQTGAASNIGLPDLFAAVKAKDAPAVSRLLRAGADPNGRDVSGMTPLHYASSRGDLRSAMLLISAGADLNAKDPGGLTPLHDAARAGSREVANLLIVSGADPGARSRAGLTPAGEAAENHHEALADYLRSKESLPPKMPEPAAPVPPAASTAPVAPALNVPPATPAPEESALSKEMRDRLRRAFDAGNWNDNIDASQQFSKETRRPILALFTGSDWCHFCKLLDAQVLSTKTFRDAVRGKYILLYVDFPRRNPAPEDVRDKRMRLAQKYGVRGYPTLVILERGDRELDRISGFKQGMTAENYVAAIQNIAR